MKPKLSSSSLPNLQTYVRKSSKERGFDSETISEKLNLLLEEVGELAKAIRKYTGAKVGDHSRELQVTYEAADVLYVLLDIANKMKIDLGRALETKEMVNQDRTWE